jgi:hypothetical protein
MTNICPNCGHCLAAKKKPSGVIKLMSEGGKSLKAFANHWGRDCSGKHGVRHDYNWESTKRWLKKNLL